MRLIVVATLIILGMTGLAEEPSRRPNIIVILADDLGYGDVGCMNPSGKIPTPHLDRLASAGMKFTDAHSASSVCTPTRYGLLTGRYAWRTKLQSGVLGGLSPRLIEPGRDTIASLLKSRGYATACIGKWHLGMDWVLKPNSSITELGIETRQQVFNVEYAKPIRNGPNAVGFDYFFGISASLDMVPYAYIENDRLTAYPSEDRQFRMRQESATQMTRQGPTAPGFEAEDVLPNLTKAAVKWIDQRAGRTQPFFLYLPLASPHTPIAPSKNWVEKSGLGSYGDFVMETDHAVGTVLEVLDKHKMTENTMIIFTSDNGCSPAADFPELMKLGHHPSHHYRGHKADIYEGGHRVPFLVRWPGIIPSGTVSDQLVCLNDVFRTVATVAGASVNDSTAEDSYNFLPELPGNEPSVRRSAMVHHSVNGSFAIREGWWKLCFCPGSGGWSSPRPGRDDASQLPRVQLFNLKEDVAEKHNVYDKHPEVVERLTRLMERYAMEGRSTPGVPRKNSVTVDFWKSGKAAMVPLKK